MSRESFLRKDHPICPGRLLLAAHLLKMFAAEMTIDSPLLSDEAPKTYNFPGNVRELKTS